MWRLGDFRDEGTIGVQTPDMSGVTIQTFFWCSSTYLKQVCFSLAWDRHKEYITRGEYLKNVTTHTRALRLT